jgi:hypothetical protein
MTDKLSMPYMIYLEVYHQAYSISLYMDDSWWWFSNCAGKLLEYETPAKLLEDKQSAFAKLVAEYWANTKRNSTWPTIVAGHDKRYDQFNQDIERFKGSQIESVTIQGMPSWLFDWCGYWK